jgi:hypothetical protein
MSQQTTDSTKVVIHMLHRGEPLCGFDRRPPKFWEKNHLWCGPENAHLCNCGECLRLASGIDQVAQVAARAAERPVGGVLRG